MPNRADSVLRCRVSRVSGAPVSRAKAVVSMSSFLNDSDLRIRFKTFYQDSPLLSTFEINRKAPSFVRKLKCSHSGE